MRPIDVIDDEAQRRGCKAANALSARERLHCNPLKLIERSSGRSDRFDGERRWLRRRTRSIRDDHDCSERVGIVVTSFGAALDALGWRPLERCVLAREVDVLLCAVAKAEAEDLDRERLLHLPVHRDAGEQTRLHALDHGAWRSHRAPGHRLVAHDEARAIGTVDDAQLGAGEPRLQRHEIDLGAHRRRILVGIGAAIAVVVVAVGDHDHRVGRGGGWRAGVTGRAGRRRL